ncbi:Transmembrane protein [Orchesella cincta]|uniref:Transmembrane protein n=1 Tax=Orchesella cincta TaxID=48709 RepID=A0A1D2N6H7_ORCCI|nr:Transmembrane protein [Orchesella cincta]
MGFANILLLSQLTGNILSLILSLCIIIPISIHQNDFRGHCLLFSTGDWRETDGQFDVSWASSGFCNYTIFVGVVLFLVSAVQIYRLSLLLYRGQDSSFLAAFFDVVGSTVLCIMTIVASLMITLGFDIWCKSITKRFGKCEDSTNNDIDKKDGIDTSSFYIQLGTAQFGAWASWACCVGLVVFATLKLCRYHQEENMRVSMARARQRLIKNAMTDDIEPLDNGQSSSNNRTRSISAPNPNPAMHSI